MNNKDNEFFGFGVDTELDNNFEQQKDFDFGSISGLGQSDYENEDIFKNDSINKSLENDGFSDYELYADENIDSTDEQIEKNDSNVDFSVETDNEYSNDYINMDTDFNNSSDTDEEFTLNNVENNISFNDEVEDFVSEKPVDFEESDEYTYSEQNFVEENNIEDESVEENTNIEENLVQEDQEKVETPKIEMSNTPIEELNKLTEYKEEKIETTDINSLFDKISVNVQDASDIFRKNTDLKEKIDTRFEELKQLQAEIEGSKKKQIDEVNNYKEEVLEKLTEKKEEIEKRLNTLKDLQASLEKEKAEFEKYKKQEKDNIEKVQKEVQAAYDSRREELEHIEDVLRKQKDALDEERDQLSLDKIQYESDKNELANNLLKFNEIVNSFTNGVSIKE